MATSIVHAVREGKFPDDDEILHSTVDLTTIPTLLEEVQKSKQELSTIVTSIGKDEGQNVDDWITQAKRIQQDIAKCKEDARQIVEQHEHLEILRATRDEGRQKADLIEAEIAFNSTLQRQINTVSEINRTFRQVDTDITERNIRSASQTLAGLTSAIATIKSDQVQSMVTTLHRARVDSFGALLRQALHDNCHITTTADKVEVQLKRPGTSAETQDLDTAQVVDCLSQTEELANATSALGRRIENVVVPHLHARSKSKIASVDVSENLLTLRLSSKADTATLMQSMSSILQFFSTNLPSKLSSVILQQLSVKAFPMLIDSWLDPAIPSNLDDLQALNALRDRVGSLVATAQQAHIAEVTKLKAWTDNLPNAWLRKRKTVSLDAVRRAFRLAKGASFPVERTETQTVQQAEQSMHGNDADDDWADNWDDGTEVHKGSEKSKDVTEDESDAWGFSADEEEPKTDDKKETDTDDADAWGWGDEDEATTKTGKIQQPASKSKATKSSNGIIPQNTAHQAIVLTETYHITDIPDYILEQVGKDNTEIQILKEQAATKGFEFLADTSEVDTLPQSTLSMYRAIAPSSYAEGTEFMPSLSTMNLYNDSLYLSQKVSEHPELSQSLRSEMLSLQKFSRQIYTSELATQRQVLSDLMDNAQGFIDCTREPNTSVCENAVSSTVDYIRTLHKQWSTILSASHTAQSIGSLLSSVMSKLIKDIEDMEDISEAQSQKLVSFMEQISKTEDLFLPQNNGSILNEQESNSSLALLHVPSYLRFHYLQQILESSLVDIKYMWTDAGLSIEFSSDEVIDLIKALFAESSHRRNAINAIRS